MKKAMICMVLALALATGAGCGGPANNSGDGSGDGGNGGDNTSRSLKIRKVNSLAPCNSQEVFMEKTIHKPYATKEPERPKRGLHRLFGGLQKKKRPDQQKGNA